MNNKTKHLSIMEFSEHVIGKYSRYIYDYGMQKSSSYRNMTYHLCFNNLMVFFNPNRVVLADDKKNAVSFECIKGIHIKESEFFDTIDVVSESIVDGVRKFRILAEKK